MIPGGFQKRKKITIKRFVKKSIALFFQEQWAGLGHYIASESGNMLSEKNIFNSVKNLTCPLCMYSAPAFVHLSNPLGIAWNSACPNCNSRSRHRGLVFLYREYLQNNQMKKILHFAPEPVLSNEIRQYCQHQYFTTDYNMREVDYPNEDIQKMTFCDSSFDVILNNHVLEHIPDDRKAIRELARILKPKGVAILTIPGNWRRKQTKTFSHLNYNGHYRDYGLDFLEMLQDSFSMVKKSNLFYYDGQKHAIKPLETAFIGIK